MNKNIPLAPFKGGIGTSKLIITVILLMTISTAHSQSILSGTVTDVATNLPVPFANIGIPNTAAGTLSNEDGTFSLTIPSNTTGSLVLFSSIGYHEIRINPDTLNSLTGIQIRLKEKILELETVRIYSTREKATFREFGNGQSFLLNGQLLYDTASAGSAMALLIDKGNYQGLTFPTKASLYIAKNLSPEFKVRLRILSVNPRTGAPANDLLQQQVIKISRMKSGWLEFEIPAPFEIKEQKFFIVFEWLMDKNDRKFVSEKYAEYMQKYPDRVSYDTVMINNEKVSLPKISTVVAGTIFGVTNMKKDFINHVCYHRSNSFGEWKRSAGILSARVILSDTPAGMQNEK